MSIAVVRPEHGRHRVAVATPDRSLEELLREAPRFAQRSIDRWATGQHHQRGSSPSGAGFLVLIALMILIPLLGAVVAFGHFEPVDDVTPWHNGSPVTTTGPVPSPPTGHGAR